MRLVGMGGAMGLAFAAMFVFTSAVRAGDVWWSVGSLIFIAVCFAIGLFLDSRTDAEVLPPAPPRPRNFTVRYRSKPEVRAQENAE